MKKIYVVTGALGHLGSTIINDLTLRKENIRIFDLKPNKLIKLDSSISEIYGDIANESDVKRLFDGLDNYEIIVIHCAGIVSIASKFDQRVYDVNVNGTKNIVKACLEYNVKKLVHISSVHAIKEEENGKVIRETKVFNPNEVVGLYAKTKSEATKIVLDACDKGLNASIIFPSGIIGPNDFGKGHTTQLLIDFIKGRLTAGVKGGYDFVDVRDVSNAIITCTDKGVKGECYLITNKYYTIKDLLTVFHEVTGKKMVKTFIPLWFAKLTSPLSEAYYKILKQKPLYTSYSLYTLQSNANFSHEKADKELGYSPREIHETIKDNVKWLKDNNLI